jgi:DNA-binding protein HU-beta
VNKAQLIDKLSSQLGGKRAAAEAVEAVVDTITRAVAAGEKVAITGFGVFDKTVRPARIGRNPRTGESVKIKKTAVPKFKAGQVFKDVVNGSKKLPKAPAPAKATATKTTAKKSAAKKAPAAKKTTAKRAPAKKTTKKTTKKAPARKR